MIVSVPPDTVSPPPPMTEGETTYCAATRVGATAAQMASATNAVSARLLDRLGRPLAVPATAAVREENGQRVAVAEAVLASLAPGDYLVELTLGDGHSRQTVVIPIRVVP